MNNNNSISYQISTRLEGRIFYLYTGSVNGGIKYIMYLTIDKKIGMIPRATIATNIMPDPFKRNSILFTYPFPIS